MSSLTTITGQDVHTSKTTSIGVNRGRGTIVIEMLSHAPSGTIQITKLEIEANQARILASRIERMIAYAITDVCLAGNPAQDGRCGDPDCVCAPRTEGI